MSDIRKFGVAETGVLKLMDAHDSQMIGDDGNPMTITLYGPGSKPHAQAQAAQNNRILERLKKRGGKSEQTAEQRAREQSEYLASCTKEFSPNIKYDDLQGEALYKAVYADISLGFIADQAAKFIGEWGNF